MARGEEEEEAYEMSEILHSIKFIQKHSKSIPSRCTTNMPGPVWLQVSSAHTILDLITRVKLKCEFNLHSHLLIIAGCKPTLMMHFLAFPIGKGHSARMTEYSYVIDGSKEVALLGSEWDPMDWPLIYLLLLFMVVHYCGDLLLTNCRNCKRCFITAEIH